jgi:hypothetical protein
MLWIGFSEGGQAEVRGIALNIPAGLSPCESFHFVFVTDQSSSSSSTNIAEYNSFVNAQAGGATNDGSVVTWFAVGSTSSVNAIDNRGQSESPVYLAEGSPTAPAGRTS